MSLIDHHFNNCHHCTAELGLSFQNSVFEKISRHLIFVKNCQNFKFFKCSSAALVSFARAYQSYPYKNYQNKSLFQPIFCKGKPKSQSLLIWKSVKKPNIRKWVLVKQKSKGSLYKDIYPHNQNILHPKSKEQCLKAILQICGKIRRFPGHAMHHLRRATHPGRATRWEFCPETRQQVFNSFPNSNKPQVGFISMVGSWFCKINVKNYDRCAM